MPQPMCPTLLCWTVVVVVIMMTDSLLQPMYCPADCQCDHTTIDCSHSQLTTVPSIRPQSSALVVNLSSNSLTSLDDLHNFPVAQTSLDLSFNRISSIPINTFSGEQFLDLHSLNLTSNLLSDTLFVLPSSLQVLKLSRNEIRQFCVERLKGLAELRVLHLEGNDLTTLACDEKSSEESEKVDKRSAGLCSFLPLPHITEVWLQGNKLTSLDPGLLDCFHNARLLSLANNSIQTLPPKIFQKFHRLRYLDLSGNRLTSVAQGMFVPMPGLKFLSLAHNRLTEVPGALPMMEWLDLSHNAIVSVPEAHKADLYPQEVFLIGGNPLHCVCDLLWLKELYDTREYLLKFVDVQRKKFIPVCASPPHIRGDSWEVLGDQAFGCKGNEETNKPVPTDPGPSTVRLDELSVKVRDVGMTHIRLDWDSVRVLREKPAESRETRKVFISCHPFGRKQEKKTAIVQLTLGSHRLRGLQPSTAYVVCVSLAASTSGAEPQFVSRNDCMEVVTKEDEESELRDIYMRISVVMVVSGLLVIKCCFTNSFQKEVSARHKEE
ncbi:hypothetical protein ACOMHN_028916 [Nucella lapillus]